MSYAVGPTSVGFAIIMYNLYQHCPIELPAVMEVVSIHAVQCGRPDPHVATER